MTDTVLPISSVGKLSLNIVLRMVVRMLDQGGISPSLPFATALPGNALPVTSMELSLNSGDCQKPSDQETLEELHDRIAPRVNEWCDGLKAKVNRTYELPLSANQARVLYAGIAMRGSVFAGNKVVLEVAYS